MLRLKANKTSLYGLVSRYVKDLPPMRTGTNFKKYPRTRDCALEWVTEEWNTARAFLAVCLGYPVLSIEVRDGSSGKVIYKHPRLLRLSALKKRGMVEEFTTAAERKRMGRAERSVEHGGLSPAT